MGIFSRFENKMEDTFEGAAGKMSRAPISPVQIAKKAEKQMRREIMVGAGREYAPTLYTVLVNPDDDARLFGYYPTLAGEIETYLSAKADQEGLAMDGDPLVRFVVDDGLKHGKFDVIAELVSAPIVEQLRAEEMQRYGLAPRQASYDDRGYQGYPGNQQNYYQEIRNDGEWDRGYDVPENMPAQSEPARKPPLPYVPEEEIDRSIDYGEYTFNSEDFEDYREKASNSADIEPPAYGYGQGGNQPQQAERADDRDYDQQPYDDRGYDQQPYDDRGYDQPGYDQVPYDDRDYDQPPYDDEDYDGEGFDRQLYEQPYEQPPAYPQGYRQPQQAYAAQQARTVAFAGGAQGGIPNQQMVHARIVDLARQRPYDLADTIVTMGRESYNDIVVQDINASRKHAELRLNQQGIWTITDLKSMNGTLVNGISVASHPLYPGDIITIGKTDYQFTIS